jgi:hypothetical protein
MKKNIIFFIVITGILVAGWFFIVHKREMPTLRTAKQLEMAGDLQKAHSLYANVVFDAMPSIDLPDINRSKVLSPEQLKKEIGKYLIWTTGSKKTLSGDVNDAFEGMKRCSSEARVDNTISDTVVRPITPEKYLDEWNKSFFAPKVKVDASHAALASGNYARRISLLVVSSLKHYTYEINLINTSTNRGQKCILYPETSVRFYAPPGEYILLCRSTVTFPTEEIWRSHFTTIPLSMPQEACLITTELRTSIHRK